MNRAIAAVCAGLLIPAFTSVAIAEPLELKTSPKDPGVINRERILYWLEKRGDLPVHATREQRDQAFQRYASRASTSNLLMQPALPTNRAVKSGAQRILKNNAVGEEGKTVKVLSVLIDFPDLPHDDNGLTQLDTDMYYGSYPVNHYQQMQFSGSGYSGPNGQILQSAHQYFERESGGSFSFEGQTYGWVTADQNAWYYGRNIGEDENDSDVPALVVEAVRKAVAANNIDLADYDLEDPYDLDGDGNIEEPDGFIDHINIFHSSIGEEAGGGTLGGDAIWSHRFFVNWQSDPDLAGASVDDSGVKVFGYTIQPIDAAIGVVVHEFGHDLGLDDEYDTDFSTIGAPVGYWSLMASGGWAGSLAGSEPAGFSALAREFLQNVYGGNWVNQVTLYLDDVKNVGRAYQLVEASNHDVGTVNQLRIDLPAQQYSPWEGEYQYYSGAGDLMNNSLVFTPGISVAPDEPVLQLRMWAHWDIEEDWDYVQIKVAGVALYGKYTRDFNPLRDEHWEDYGNVYEYISGRSADIPESTGPEGWVLLEFGMWPENDHSIPDVTIEYVTDAYVGGYGFVVDKIEIVQGDNVLWSDDAETAGTATLDGFTRTGAIEGEAQNYWVQMRSHNGVDSGLEDEGYEHGMLLWFGNENYSDNNVDAHPGFGFVGVVDADQIMIGTEPSEAQVKDAPFSLYSHSTSWGDSSTNGNSLFRDEDDYSSPTQPQSGLVLPEHGLEIEVLSQAGDSSSGTVEVRVQGAAPAVQASISTSVSDLTVDFDAQPSGGDGSYTYSWDFGDNGSSSDKSPQHTYASAGTYTVQLQVSDGSGGVAQVQQSVTVTAASSNSGTSSGSSGSGSGSGGGGGGPIGYLLLMLLALAGYRRRAWHG
ncbi:immune inhibitor A domain-containing protein [Biformimicrobium ophioploci]|uniref:Immune inhibitor A n=1 Tax=Biformimicrobium ophioploci TaxID=3036711 RepID=A0ABQ6LWE4_9GAMM|nr:immune inhibitor A domain-containing protein [Microbulbifer sp. NKW57]GMG86383.1 immune inhibitor A [Microbulbifer sp. NKW57]